jgi:hypothetical protein
LIDSHFDAKMVYTTPTQMAIKIHSNCVDKMLICKATRRSELDAQNCLPESLVAS